MKSVLNFHWKDWCWSWNSITLATWYEELTIWKVPDAGKDWGQEEKRMTEDEMSGWHHQLIGHEFEWTPGVGDGQGGLACCSPWGHKESAMTEQLNWLTGWISLQSKGLSSVFSSTTVWKHQVFSAQPSLWSSSHIHTWLLVKLQPWLDGPLWAKRCLCFLAHCLGLPWLFFQGASTF